MRAGKLDRRITIQRAQTVMNEMNEPVKTWSDIATIWAGRSDVSDGEKEAAGQLGSFLISRFLIRTTSTTKAVKPIDRLLHDGAVWNIHGIKDAALGRDRFIEITAARDLD